MNELLEAARSVVRLAQGKGAEAEQFYRRALSIKEKVLGPEHPDVAMTLNNLAVLCKANENYAEAEALYARSLAIFEQALGPQHPKVITCRKNYAGLLRKMNRHAEASVLEAQANSPVSH